MNETPQQYIARIMSYLDGQDPLKIQIATPKKLAKILKGATSAKLRKRLAPGKWSAAEILAHLSDVEFAIGWRLRQILGAPGTPIQAFDQDAWFAAGHYDKRDARKSAEQFIALREANLALLKSLTPKQWEDYGMHAERGKETIRQVARMNAGHDINHLRQLEALLQPKSRR